VPLPTDGARTGGQACNCAILIPGEGIFG